MCKWGTDKIIHVIRRNNDYISDGWHEKAVDACIADYVQEMNDKGIITVGCCCGHFKDESQVLVDIESCEILENLNYKYKITFEYPDPLLVVIVPDERIDQTI